MGSSPALGIGLAVLAFLAIGMGVGAAGTALLALLASRVTPARRAPAATLVWVMMIFGFVVTTAICGRLLDPYSPGRLVTVVAGACLGAFILATLAVWRLEGPARPAPTAVVRTPFRQALAEIWAEPEARRFTIFVFLSMLAYSAQDLILEPFAGLVFGLSLGESTSLASLQHGGVLAGMVLVALLAPFCQRRFGLALRQWVVWGCVASAAAFVALVVAAGVGPGWPLASTWFCLGLANGVFAAAAIAMMMQLAGKGQPGREGTRMGLWGAAQGLAFGLGGLFGAVAVDLARWLLGAVATAYGGVFALEAALFIWAAVLAARLSAAPATTRGFIRESEA
jgi:BCD family chlorophyll transporter-like MFS transporter